MAENALSVCVVGLGLMGGSLALALREAHWAERLIGVDRDVAMLATAKWRCDRCRHDGAGGGRRGGGCCAAGRYAGARHDPAPCCLMSAATRAGALIMDLGSTKQQICRAMTGLPEGLEPVGGHPMCGKEVAGFAAAEATLFQQRPFVLCPISRTARPALELARSLALAIGALAGRARSGGP